MTNHKTVAGNTHFAQRLAGAGLTNAFDAIELGTGNTAIGTGDTRSSMTSKITGTLKQVEATYPKLNDGDVANVGRGADVWTYKFIIPSGAGAFAATNFHLTNYVGGAPSATEPVGIVGNGHNIVGDGVSNLTIYLNVTQG